MDDTQQAKGDVQANNAAQQPQGGQAPVQPAVQQPAQTASQPAVEIDSDRTKNQFEKLLDSNRQLFEANQQLRNELQQRRETAQQFAPVQLPPVQQQQPVPQVNPADFIETDPYTGEKVVNTEKLNAKLEEVNSRASRAEEAVQRYIDTSEQREIERQNKEAFNAYPELNPADPKHNVVFHNQTRAVIYDSVLNPQDYGGQPLSFVDAAKYVKAHQSSNAGSTVAASPEGATAPAQEQQQTQEQQAAQELKQQASASPAAQSLQERQSEVAPEEIQRLRLRTRLGDPQALAERLANTEHVKPKAENAS